MSRTITIRLNDDLYDELVEAAQEEHRSLNNLINVRLSDKPRSSVSKKVSGKGA